MSATMRLLGTPRGLRTGIKEYGVAQAAGRAKATVDQQSVTGQCSRSKVTARRRQTRDDRRLRPLERV